jgi:hypothetical protein
VLKIPPERQAAKRYLPLKSKKAASETEAKRQLNMIFKAFLKFTRYEKQTNTLVTAHSSIYNWL